MNVKPGDLARIVAPYHPNGRGSIVAVIEPALPDPVGMLSIGGVNYFILGNAWVVHGWVKNWKGIAIGPLTVVEDGSLRRIPPLGEDETIGEVTRLPEVA